MNILDVAAMLRVLSFSEENEKTRKKWVEEKLKSISAGENLLDAGAGERQYEKFCDHLKYISQDFCEYTGGEAEGLTTSSWDTTGIDIVSDIINMPIQDNTIDNILCTEVIEHIKKPELAIAEFARVIKNGGRLYLTAPFSSLTHFAPYHYCTGFNIYWYEEILSEYGFVIEEATPNGNYFSQVSQEVLRVLHMSEKYGIKLYIWNKIRIIFMVRLLNKIAKKGVKSSEVWNFGYMIVAKKV